ncbi:MAG: VWA domain-containing protein [Polyangia bacterium]
MGTIAEPTLSKPRPLPVILLADVSGSMQEYGKIEALNGAVSEMLGAFAAEDRSRAEIHVGIITFGGGAARIHLTLQPAHEVAFQPFAATGNTPLGRALTLARELIEDPAQVPHRAYRPTLALISDGQPNDEWEAPLAALLASPRAQKAARFAMAIGPDADQTMLARFLADPAAKVVEAHQAREIRRFFRWVTMTVTARSRSLSPSSDVPVQLTDLDDLEF